MLFKLTKRNSFFYGMNISIIRAKTFRTRKNFPGSNASLLPGFLGLWHHPRSRWMSMESNLKRVQLRNSFRKNHCMNILTLLVFCFYHWLNSFKRMMMIIVRKDKDDKLKMNFSSKLRVRSQSTTRTMSQTLSTTLKRERGGKTKR